MRKISWSGFTVGWPYCASDGVFLVVSYFRSKMTAGGAEL